MPKICYTNKRFPAHYKAIIAQAVQILEEYRKLGFTRGLTLRQLYYQFVARDWLPNKQKVYKSLGNIIAQARLCGMIDWYDIEDRTRFLRGIDHYDGFDDAMRRAAADYRIDLWKNQLYRPEVWIEKDALIGVFEDVCVELDIPFFSCRGYTSLSEMWRASMRLRGYVADGKRPLILHFGDHDPSGIDMSRDIFDRIQKTFMTPLEMRRLALTMEQIEEYEPPPNPAKVTDSRYQSYVEKFGTESWELDALDPRQFRVLIEKVWDEVCDKPTWDHDKKEEARTKQLIVEAPEDLERLKVLSKDHHKLVREHRDLQDKLKETEHKLGDVMTENIALKSRKRKKD